MRLRTPGLLALAGLGLTGMLTGCTGADPDPPPRHGSSSTAAAYVPAPVIDQDFPDPDVLRVGDTYYAYATQTSNGARNIQLATSADLQTWTVLEQDALPKLPTWATNGRTWAPDVSAVAGGFVMYLTAHSVDPDVQCIGVARSVEPTGPFVPVGSRPLVCPAAAGGAIDAASYVEPEGTRYLLWKNDGNCCGKDTWLHLQPVSRDGLRTTGPPRRLVRQDQGWEGDLVEAPTLVRHGSSYLLLYSANDYGGAAYATGYAVSEGLSGPYVKADRPLMTTAGTGVTGPGGQDVVTTPTGESLVVFHGWDPAVIYRGMYVARLDWHGTRPEVVVRGLR